MGWNSQVHRRFPGKFESANLSGENLSREIRRSRAARCEEFPGVAFGSVNSKAHQLVGTCVCVYIYINKYIQLYIYTHIYIYIYIKYISTALEGRYCLEQLPTQRPKDCPQSLGSWNVDTFGQGKQRGWTMQGSRGN